MAKTSDLAQIIADTLNKGDGGKIAYILGTESSPTDLKDFISTGSSILDIAISNRKHGGIAVGRITELQGLEGSGKSLIGAHLIAEVQRRGGQAVLIDTETSFHEDFFRAVGIDIPKMVYINETLIEKIFEAIENIVEIVRKLDSDRLVIIVVDSVAGSTTETEAESDHGKEGYATAKALIISKAMRKITKMIGTQRIALVFTNQLRLIMGASLGQDPYTTSGGKAIGFHSSTRIRFQKARKIKNTKDGPVVGIDINATIIKNRLGPPYRVATFPCYFDFGIDDHLSWFDVMKKHGLINVPPKSAWGTWVDPETDEEIKFQRSTFTKLVLNTPERTEVVYNQMADALITSYRGRDETGKELKIELSAPAAK